MRVILKEVVPNLGDAGDIVNVKPGYGRNFLIPRGLAMPASEGSVRQMQHQQRVADNIRKKQLVAAEELAGKIKDVAVTIRKEAGEDDKLFGSVTKRDIVEALAAEGVEIDRRCLELDDNIRSIGLFNVPVRIHKEVTGQIKVYVMRS
jgi:large subunit ribosomal protein L9